MTVNRASLNTKRTLSAEHDAPDVALSMYLDSMLHEATLQQAKVLEHDVESVNEKVVPEIKPVSEKPVFKGKSLSELKAAAKARTAKTEQENEIVITKEKTVELQAEQRIVETENLVQEIAQEKVREKLSTWKAGELPDWAGEQFDCLMFKVDGLTLGVPMLLLGTLYPIESDLTPLFDQANWFLGLMRTGDDKNIRIVDTAALVMPNKQDKKHDSNYQFAIGIFGTDWAMGAHHISGSKLISTSQVKWRTSRTSRAWLAGTIKEEMCAIVDPKAFVDLLLERNLG